MAKTTLLITPICKPMFRMTSSTKPRVFMRIPMADDSRQFNPVRRAATVDPPNFPRHATNIIAPVKPHRNGLFNSPIRVEVWKPELIGYKPLPLLRRTSLREAWLKR